MTALRELDAFAAECQTAEATLHDIPDEAWSLPGLGEWNLAELVAHLTRGAGRLSEYADERRGHEEEPVCDRVSYWLDDLEAEAPAIAERARQAAAAVTPTEWPDRFARAWRASASAVEQLGPEAVIPTLRGPMQVVEYLATRVLEVTVHHADVRSALDLPPVGMIEAEQITQAILELLLDGPRPRNLGRHRFILAATGRTTFDDPRFPVLR